MSHHNCDPVTERAVKGVGRFPGLDEETNAVWERLARVARTRLPVLILGETGTGKELAAEWVFERGGAIGGLLKVNCAGLSESVVESELFGHERGAFTGALATRSGIFEAAHGGTLFLDEVGELPLSTQAKLLRVLESGEIVRLGSARPRRIDVRVISATHRQLPERVAAGAFREDLYFRLNGVSVRIPPLRARRSEILPFAYHFLERSARADGAATPALLQSAERQLLEHSWPGNVRELRYVMERAYALRHSGAAAVEHLELGLGLAPAVTRTAQPPEPSQDSMRDRMKKYEFEQICAALEQTEGNQTRAARLMGISRRTLTNKLNAYGLPRPRKRGSAAASKDIGS